MSDVLLFEVVFALSSSGCFRFVDALDSLCDYGLNRDVVSLYRADVDGATVFAVFPEWYGAFGRWQGLVCEQESLGDGRYAFRIGGQSDADIDMFREWYEHDETLVSSVRRMAFSDGFEEYERSGEYDLSKLGHMLGLNGYGLQFPDDFAYEEYEGSVFSKLDQTGSRLSADMCRLLSDEMADLGIGLSDAVVTHRLDAPGMRALFFDPSGGKAPSFVGVLVVGYATSQLGMSDVVVGAFRGNGGIRRLSDTYEELSRLRDVARESGAFDDRVAVTRCERAYKDSLRSVILDVRSFVRRAPESARMHFRLPPSQAVVEGDVIAHLAFNFSSVGDFGFSRL